MVSTISRRERIHQTTLNCNITPNISSILQRLFHGGITEAARQHGAPPSLHCVINLQAQWGSEKSKWSQTNNGDLQPFWVDGRRGAKGTVDIWYEGPPWIPKLISLSFFFYYSDASQKDQSVNMPDGHKVHTCNITSLQCTSLQSFCQLETGRSYYIKLEGNVCGQYSCLAHLVLLSARLDPVCCHYCLSGWVDTLVDLLALLGVEDKQSLTCVTMPARGCSL